jgi:hypothetical protein
MKKSRFTESQIVAILKEGEAGERGRLIARPGRRLKFSGAINCGAQATPAATRLSGDAKVAFNAIISDSPGTESGHGPRHRPRASHPILTYDRHSPEAHLVKAFHGLVRNDHTHFDHKRCCSKHSLENRDNCISCTDTSETTAQIRSFADSRTTGPWELELDRISWVEPASVKSVGHYSCRRD